MKTLGDRQRHLLRRGATGAALLLAGLLAVVLLIVATGSVVISALNTGDPIKVVPDVDFGIVLPGADYPHDFEICIKEPVGGDHVDYTLTLTEKPVDPLDPGPGFFPDMRPFLIVQAVDDPNEDEDDPVADGPAGDYEAKGELDAATGDDCDKWEITLTAPHCEGAYNPATDPQGNPVTIDCIQKKPTADPQTWSEGSDLGADLKIYASRS